MEERKNTEAPPATHGRSQAALRFLHRVCARARGKVTLRTVFKPYKWRFWLRNLRDEYYRLRREADAGPGLALPPLAAFDTYVENNAIRPHVRVLLCTAADTFAYKPLVSVVMPVYNGDPRWLQAAIDSVRDQIYPHWELCIADDASTRTDTLEVLRSLAGDPRIKVVYRQENGHICRASNDAAALATGEFIGLLDQDDLLAPHALFEIVRLLQTHHDADLVYSDEDKIGLDGRHYDPHFKPDWSPVLLLGYNYINHLTCLRRSVFDAVGQFRPGSDGAQDYDLLLRVTERTSRVHHIAKILYHWRSTPQSVATTAAAKPIVKSSADAALTEHLQRLGITASVYQPDFAKAHALPINQLDWPDDGPSVEIIIVSTNEHSSLRRCLDSIIDRTTYANYRVMVLNHGANPADTRTYLETLHCRGVRVERLSGDAVASSLSRAHNEAAKRSTADYVLFLRDDIEVLEPRWLSRLVGYAQLPGVGATGVRVCSRDGHIKNAGILLDTTDGRAPAPAFRHHPCDRLSYFFLAETARECSAVSAGLLTRRATLLQLGGFDAEPYPVALAAVDYCLRLEEARLRCVYVSGAEVMQHGPSDDQPHPDPNELLHFRRAHRPRPDRYYNPNLSTHEPFTVAPDCTLDYEQFLPQPLNVKFFTHSLQLEGSAKVVVDLALGLAAAGRVRPSIATFADGPLRARLDSARIPVQTIVLPGVTNLLAGWEHPDVYDRSVTAVVDLLKQERPDVVLANVVNCFFVVEAAARVGIPSVWLIHESYDADTLVRNVPPYALPVCEAAFSNAHRVIFVSHETSRMYERYQTRGNFSVVHNALQTREIEAARQAISREAARAAVGLEPGRNLILAVGTVCPRKDQETLVRAAALLARTRGDFRVDLVGARETDPYVRDLKRLIAQLGLGDCVQLVPETPEVHTYYRAADVLAFTSLIESYSLTILEAMAHGLPIVTTPCGGVSEQVRFGLNALRVPVRDPDAVAAALARLLEDAALREQMGSYSRTLFSLLPAQAEVLDRYWQTLFGAWCATPWSGAG